MTTSLVGTSPHKDDLEGDARWHAVAGCRCEWCENQRRQRREADLFKKKRRGCTTLMPSEAECAEAIERVRELHESGLGITELGRLTGVADSNLCRMLQGVRVRIRRGTYDRIMAADPSQVTYSTTKRRAGTHIDPTGTRRRLMALNAIGFSYAWMGKQLGCSSGTHISAMVIGVKNTQWISYNLAEAVKELYERYENENPLDYGIPKHAVNRLIIKGKRDRYPTPSCWDTDTIDDPDATADWTGACGTSAGYYRHRAADLMPPCEPCTTAMGAVKAARDVKRKEARRDNQAI